jgi:hypothetical protein
VFNPVTDAQRSSYANAEPCPSTFQYTQIAVPLAPRESLPAIEAARITNAGSMHFGQQLLGLRDCGVRQCEDLHGLIVFANAGAVHGSCPASHKQLGGEPDGWCDQPNRVCTRHSVRDLLTGTG